MRKLLLCTIPIIAMLGTAVAQEPTPMPTTTTMTMTKTMPMHAFVNPMDIKWGAPPPVLEKNAKFAVLSGDPSKAGIFVARLKVPAGYKVKPHWHSNDEHVTVISGTFALGMGEKFDKAAMTTLPTGSYALLPADMRHYAMAKTAAVVQIESMGPFTLTYVDPNDDPSKK